MAKKFPVHASHEGVSCFNCGGDLVGDYFHDSGNADGHGRWEQSCEKCQMSTWYDLAPSPVHLECTGPNRFKLHMRH